MQRRTFLRSTSVATLGITLLAGCGSPGPSPDDGDGTETELGGGETETEMGGETETEMGGETETEMGGETETEMGGDLDLDGMVGEVPEGIEVSNTALGRTDGSARVTGVVENTGDQAFEEVEVQATLLDDNDEILGQFFHDTEQAEVSSLEPGQQWEFSIDFPEEDLEDAASYRIDVDTEIDENVDFEIDTETETAAGG